MSNQLFGVITVEFVKLRVGLDFQKLLEISANCLQQFPEWLGKEGIGVLTPSPQQLDYSQMGISNPEALRANDSNKLSVKSEE